MNIDEVLEIIAKYAKIEKDKLDLNSSFKNDLHLDSIDLFQIVMEVEDKYNIKLDDEQLLEINTVSDAIERIKNAK